MRWNSSALRLLMAFVVVWIGVRASAQTQSAPAPSPVAPSTVAASSAPIPKPLLIIIDAAHGGSDPGAVLTPTTAEKDVTLALARRLRQELNSRGILCQLVRDGDATLPVDQRASIVNTADPALYIGLHASSLSGGMRVFTAMVSSDRDNKGPFLDWDAAQAHVLDRSKAIEAQLAAAIQKTRFPVRALSAPLQPLNNLRSPAIAIEISPTTADASQVATAGYQQMICAAVANAIASISPLLRGNAGTQP